MLPLLELSAMLSKILAGYETYIFHLKWSLSPFVSLTFRSVFSTPSDIKALLCFNLQKDDNMIKKIHIQWKGVQLSGKFDIYGKIHRRNRGKEWLSTYLDFGIMLTHIKD